MPSYPFHSPEVREALLEILSNRERGSGGGGGGGRPSHRATAAAGVGPAAARGVRGRAPSPPPSSSDDDDDGEGWDGGGDGDEYGDDSDSSSSSSSSSSLTAVDDDGAVATIDALDADDDARQHGGSAGGVGGGHRRGKKIGGKKGGGGGDDRLLRRMGKAPSLLLPLDDDCGGVAPRRMALEVPIALLPTDRRARDMSHASAATELLSAWDRLTGGGRDGGAPSSSPSSAPTVIVVLLRSGRFVSAVFSLTKAKMSKTIAMTMIAHRTSTKYTVRKGQGGSQSNHDQSKSKAKSVGAQLRREGEKRLREDVHDAWKEWRTKGHVSNAAFVYVSCPKGMRRDYLYAEDGSGGGGGGGGGLLEKGDARWRDVPLDVGRPTLDAATAVLERLMACEVREMSDDERGGAAASGRRSPVDDDARCGGGRRRGGEDATRSDGRSSEDAAASAAAAAAVVAVAGGAEIAPEAPPPPPYTPLHEAVADGDLPRLMDLLALLDRSGGSSVDGGPDDEDGDDDDDDDDDDRSAPVTTTAVLDYDVNTRAGQDLWTPLHVASSSDRPDAAAFVSALLVRGRADPCATDSRGRPPYFVARTDGIREAFRYARGRLGEDAWTWDAGAKVGPALTDADVRARKAKAAEKKRRQRARKKDAKAEEKAEAEEAAARERSELEAKRREEEARRARDGLRPKASSAVSNACDFCQKVVKGKKRSQMFQRLQYAYCTTECVKGHQRELTAAAATRRSQQ